MEQSDTYWTYYPEAIPAHTCTTTSLQKLMLEHTRDEVNTTQLHHSHQQPLFAFFSEPPGLPYRCFKTTVYGLPFPPEFSELLDLPMCQGVKFDAAFINLYRSGKDSVTPHRDNTHGIEHPIVSFSLYEDRDSTTEADLRSLYIAPSVRGGSASNVKNIYEPCAKIMMENRSAVVMHPGMQDKYVHWVPETNSEKYRINITFRVHKTL